LAAQREAMTQVLDQLLFGYRDGHELLAGSRELSALQQRDMLPHIDASFERADEQQLVGTPIPSLDGYLLARIWPAPEQARPGAVWAHALLLTAEQLRCGRLGGLLGLLRRPVDGRFGGYGDKLAWPSGFDVTTTPQPLARAVTWAALVADQRPRVLLWHDAVDAEHALIAQLDALPGGARKELSFRTRERARLGASAYSVQVASLLSGRTAAATGIVIDARRPPAAALPDWASLLDQTDSAAQRRAFLRRYGDQDAHTRQQVLALAAIAAELDAHAAPAVVIRRLVESFPDPHEMLDLRLDLLGAAEAHVGLWRLGEAERLTLLLAHRRHFDLRRLGVDRRVANLWRTDPQGARRLAERARHLDPGDPWRRALLDTLPPAASPAAGTLPPRSDAAREPALERRPRI